MDNDMTLTTGERIRIQRKKIGLSAEKLAETLHVSPATIYRYENGEIEKVPGNLLAPISEALSTTPAYLMGWSDSPVRNLSVSYRSDDTRLKTLISLYNSLDETGKSKLFDCLQNGPCNSPMGDKEKSPGTDESAPGDEMNQKIMALVYQMDSSQKEFLYELLRTTAEKNQGLFPSAQGSDDRAVPKSANRNQA